MTEKEAFKKHFKLWDWLTKNPDKNTWDWPGWKDKDNKEYFPIPGNFLCLYYGYFRSISSYYLVGCYDCILARTYHRSCCADDSIHYKWKYEKNINKRIKYAKLIRDVVKKENKKNWR